MKLFKIVIPTTVVVFVSALWILEKDHSTVPLYIRILISLGGALLSGILTYFLMRQDAGDVDQNANN
ncbi:MULTISPECIES: hypothetical protein [Bacillaceae]|uniref:hypothetical protein n=1 Tax=Bacillaceae TaxID=186817 RepID=UPI000BFE1E62|nr:MULTISPECIES: hypothetical protein [Bacillaceae]MCM3164324.1 hypothetical protein [Metabacillus litoralis]PGT80096.1 hypothetical protein COD11_21895 [Bacillus sp. AFS040349]UGB33734.1 hypothetical protein LPC09_26130 [Metabacillus sp. B2-18]